MNFHKMQYQAIRFEWKLKQFKFEVNNFDYFNSEN